MTSNISLQTTIDIAAIVNQQQQDAAGPGSEANRHDLAEALKASYEAQGNFDVTPEMIDRGLDAYFADRLRYKGYQGSGIASTLGGAYLTVFSHRKLLAGILSCALLVGVSFSFFENQLRSAVSRSIAAEFTEMSAGIQQVNAEWPEVIAGRQAWLEHARNHGLTFAKLGYEKLLESYELKLSSANDALIEINKRVGQSIPQPDVEEVAADPASFKNISLKLKSSRDSQIASFNGSRDAMDTIQKQADGLATAEKSYVQAAASQEFKQIAGDDDVLSRSTVVEQSLTAGDTASAVTAIGKLNQVVAIKLKNRALVARANALVESYSGVFNYAESKAIATALFAQASYAAGQGDASGVNDVGQQLKALKVQEAQAAMDLTIRVVDRPDMKSGLARMWNATGNKRFYLMMEAVNKAGIPQVRLIYNNETSKTEAVSVWGQEVAEPTFRAVAADKQKDGVLDDRVFGSKPAGTYAPVYARPVLTSTITRWPESK